MSLLATPASATELQWRRGGPKHFHPTADSQPIARTAKPPARRDGAVRAVAFEGEGPSFATQAAGNDSLHSVVAEDRQAFESAESRSVRSAQLQFGPSSEGDNRYNEQITEPFGQQSVETESSETVVEEEIALPPADSTNADLAPPSVDDGEINVPDTTSRQPDAQQRQPRTFEPTPSTSTPRSDPFVEADDEPDAGLPPVDDPTLADEGSKAQADCAEEFAKLKAHTLDQVNLSIAVSGKPGEDFPYECGIDDGTWYTGRCWNETTYMWKASALCHKPLYFEDEALERYGHSWGPYLDPVVSGAHFFCKLPVLPYCMGLTPPNECVYALGHYRPGNCAPYMIDPVPLSCRAAAVEAAAVTGTVFVLP